MIHPSIDRNQEAVGIFYFDPLPTNCVANWVCPRGTGAGYPKYAYSTRPEYGYKNLATFLGACSFDCLFCQNSSYKEMAIRGKPIFTAENLDDMIKVSLSSGGIIKFDLKA
ncbi:MAG TPA: hypothetical protein PLO64_00585 [Methanothermobacter sp.]|nr:radical SAM domain protein [Methanothermobacter sp. MT-2]HHW04647.1 hypothetical protein [Methanothermobacter sp.]HOK72112.1 hypothetical protein [Methanothermobacter sp.]HOL68425.1 hypothetical protein [Methanothermobacter sp.]HPQ04183.1 hypothetical protein [Methanothermobacter sp.]